MGYAKWFRDGYGQSLKRFKASFDTNVDACSKTRVDIPVYVSIV